MLLSLYTSDDQLRKTGRSTKRLRHHAWHIVTTKNALLFCFLSCCPWAALTPRNSSSRLQVKNTTTKRNETTPFRLLISKWIMVAVLNNHRHGRGSKNNCPTTAIRQIAVLEQRLFLSCIMSSLGFLLLAIVSCSTTLVFFVPVLDNVHVGEIVLSARDARPAILPPPLGMEAPLPQPSSLRKSDHDVPKDDTIVELLRATTTTPPADAHSFRVSPLQAPVDYERFTVRINTWKRPEQLAVSIAHHKSCATLVAHIQVVWCTDQGEVPAWLLNDPDVTVERHAVNSLNERFNLLEEPPTAAVLSIDDDVLRPCLALESGFHKWTMNPNRQVGFDARSHQVVDISTNRWGYAYMSTTEKTNLYSITLTRCCFTHRDYLRWYKTQMPAVIRDFVATHFNCEDIAMSLAISSLTGGQPPLLADYWAVKAQIKLYVDTKISGGKDHKTLRNDCMDSFANVLQLKNRLIMAPLKRENDAFEYGVKADNWNRPKAKAEPETIQRWKKQGFTTMLKEIGELRAETAHVAYDAGLLKGSEPWKQRFAKHG
jgi:glucuronyl/N-acetylglucosaminyl transferase EXT2